ncbi:MAG: winged helix-turn-helix domain-containing protein [Elusimicrobiota bacterium]
MWTPLIGENAGKIWQALNTKGQSNLTGIKKATRLNDQNLYLALGWLAREGKIKFEQKQKNILVSLIK